MVNQAYRRLNNDVQQYMYSYIRMKEYDKNKTRATCLRGYMGLSVEMSDNYIQI